MKKIQAVIATTNVDRQGEQITPDVLWEIAGSLGHRYVPMGMHHDPYIPPYGRVVGGEIRDGEDGRLELLAEIEVWDGTDTPESLAGDGRTIPFRSTDGLEVHFDHGFRQGDGPAFLNDLRQLLGEKATFTYNAKKEAYPAPTLIIAAGLFIVGSIGKGFLTELGKDLAKALKEKLTLRKLANPAEKVSFVLGATHESMRLDIEILFPTGTPDDLRSFIEIGFDQIDEAVTSVVSANERVARVVLLWENSAWSLHYWVRDDGVPSVITPVSIETIEGMGFSFQGSATSVRAPRDA